MDPLNKLNAMHLQETLPDALDLSLGCKQIPVTVETLDIVKPIWSNSGTNDVVVGASGARPESYNSKPFKQVQSDVPQLPVTSESSYESRCSAVPTHNLSSVPLLNGGLPATQCPTSNPLFTEDGRAGAEMDQVFTHLSECPQKALTAASENTKTDTETPPRTKDPTERAKNLQNGLCSQPLCIRAGCHGKCTADTVSSRTRGDCNSSSCTPSLHSTGSASFTSEGLSIAERHALDHKHIAVVARPNCTSSGENSSCSVECISSDESDVVEVPVSSCARRQISKSPIQTGKVVGKTSPIQTGSVAGKTSPPKTGSVGGKKMIHGRESLSSPWQDSDCAGGMAGERVARNGYGTAERRLCDPAEPGRPPSPPIVLLDSDPETEFVSRNVPSTSDAENAEHHALGHARDEGSSSTSSTPLLKDGPDGAPAPKKKNQGSTGSKQAALGKEAASMAKRRRRKARPSGASSMFAPREPEIKLKYANHKEEKREGGGPCFSPYIRVELSACTIVNFREEDDDAQAKKGRQAAASCVSPGVVPSTSRLVLGRPNAGGSARPDQVCCLCGRMSNTSGLGDLHGPYYPCGPPPNNRTPLHPVEGGAPGPRPQAESLLGAGGVLDSEEMSPTKRLRKQRWREEWPGAAEGEGERWVHEDCSVWSAGVFLVKGNLYGLEEALKLTRDTVCSCCHGAGATLGCFFKGCPNKYHFPCAVQADCVLSEENFTTRCPKHKNKSPRISTSRLQNR